MADAFDKLAALFHDGRKFFKRCAAAFLSLLTKFSVKRGIPAPPMAVAKEIKIIVTLFGLLDK